MISMSNPCSFCKAGCCSTYTITVTSFDVLRICGTGKKPEDFAVLHEPRLLGFDPDVVLNTTDGYERYLLGIRSHPCVFLKDNLCTVHEHAPTSCRLFPFTVSGTLNTRFCPFPSQLMFRVKGPDIRKELLAKEVSDYKKIVAKWNRNFGTREECIPFLLKETASSF